MSRGAALFLGSSGLDRFRFCCLRIGLDDGDPARADHVFNVEAGSRTEQRGQQVRNRDSQHHSPLSQSARSLARRFTKPGSTRPPPIFVLDGAILPRVKLYIHTVLFGIMIRAGYGLFIETINRPPVLDV
nr:hypothetical protein [Burkholderia cepacia]